MDDRRDVAGKAISISFQIGDSAITNISKARIAKHNTTSLCGLQCVLCPLCDHLAFVLCHGRQDVNGELVGVGIIDGDKFNARIHQRCDESEIVGQAIQLGDNQLGPLPLADRQSLLEFGPLVALTALDLGELADQRPSATIQVVVDSLVLRLEAKAGFPLLVSGDSVIGDEPAPMRRHTVLPRWRKDTPRPAVDRHHHTGRQAHVSGLRCLCRV